MNGKLKYLSGVAVLSFAAFTTSPALAGPASSFQAVFYELTEDATFVFDSTGTFVSRTGSGSLAGDAKIGTLLCPAEFVAALVAAGYAAPGAPCYVTATGTDVINANGLGHLHATIEVKVQGDNPVDAPESVVMIAELDGSLWVAEPQMRLLGISGTLTTPAATASFSGMVRLPFVPNPDGSHRKPRRHEPAFYLGDTGKLIPVRQNERSLGLPTARFELNFGD